jgi:uncharacterized protein YcbK (DUF882 family)
MLCVKLAEDGERLSENFAAKEFACRCCGKVLVHPELVRKLQALRSAAGAPVVIASGYRCAGHNRECGGAVNSYHLYGMAADIWVGGVSTRNWLKGPVLTASAFTLSRPLCTWM